MYFSPTIFVAKLLAAMQVLMTLEVPLSTTMALPVTSKPIESTVENLAWQAWIELPPEQKQKVKSRKVTPKSIFTLPLRVECPEGHKQVDSKCIPLAIGSNAVLIDLNALGLLVGNTPTDDIYDYDDMAEELSNPLAFSGGIPAGEGGKSSDGLAVDLKPPAEDEPLKFNIFQNKFHIFHEEPFEDYAGLSNEGLHSSEKQQNMAVTTTPTNTTATNPTAVKGLVSDASNISENISPLLDQLGTGVSSGDEGGNGASKASLNIDDGIDFKVEAISVPAFANHSSIQLVTTIIEAETTTAGDEYDKQHENDLTTLLQTESFLPLLNHTTATTLQNPDPFSLKTMTLREPGGDLLSLGVDEESTTITAPPEQNARVTKTKQEYTRSVTLNPLSDPDFDGITVDASGDDDELQETTLKTVTNDFIAETTTPIQLDETTIIESHSSPSATFTRQEDLEEFLFQQEEAQKHFQLQRRRKGQKDQHEVLKKSKVEPVKMLPTTTEEIITTTIATATATAETTVASLPTATKRVDELFSTTAETATPLLTVHNENENNDRFYYQHVVARHNNDEVDLHSAVQFKQNAAESAAAASSLVAVAVTGQPPATTTTTAATTAAATTKSYETKTIPSTSEIDLAEELRLINDLVKGIRKPTTLTTITKMPTTTTTTPNISTDHIKSSSSSNALSESTTSANKNSTLTTSQIWSQILPLLTTSTATPIPKNSANESFSESSQKESNVTQTSDTTTHAAFAADRSNRNSKIIRINGFNKMSAAKLKAKDFTTATTTAATTTEEFSPHYSTTISSPSGSSTENLTSDPYWWIPASWRLDKPTSTEKQPQQQQHVAHYSADQPLLLRLWSAYAAKSS